MGCAKVVVAFTEKWDMQKEESIFKQLKIVQRCLPTKNENQAKVKIKMSDVKYKQKKET